MVAPSRNGFQRVTLFGEGVVIADASVFGGGQSSVGLISKGDVDIFLPRARVPGRSLS